MFIGYVGHRPVDGSNLVHIVESCRECPDHYDRVVLGDVNGLEDVLYGREALQELFDP